MKQIIKDLKWNKKLMSVAGMGYKERAIDKIMGYVRWNRIMGGYFEFGTYQGESFINAYKASLSNGVNGMWFHAFDSFEGLPEPKGSDVTGEFEEGMVSCSVDEWLANLKRAKVDMRKVAWNKGFFKDTLKDASALIAIAWIDCDLYQSTKEVLEFLTPNVQEGMIIVFDDWNCFKANNNFGQRRAAQEWIEANDDIKLMPLFSYGWHGQVFVCRVEREAMRAW